MSEFIKKTVLHTYVPNYRFKIHKVKNLISLKGEIHKIKITFWGLAQWFTPVIPALWEAKVGGSPKIKSSRPAWSTRWNPVSTKNTKISWAWWCASVVPATQEAEAGELLEPRRRRLWWAEMAPLHSSLGNKSKTQSQNKTKENFLLFANNSLLSPILCSCQT